MRGGTMDRHDGGDLVTTTPEQPDLWPTENIVPIEELTRRQGVRSITSLDELAVDDPFESDEEYAESSPASTPPARVGTV
jgi:hypothetical protein